MWLLVEEHTDFYVSFRARYGEPPSEHRHVFGVPNVFKHVNDVTAAFGGVGCVRGGYNGRLVLTFGSTGTDSLQFSTREATPPNSSRTGKTVYSDGIMYHDLVPIGRNEAISVRHMAILRDDPHNGIRGLFTKTPWVYKNTQKFDNAAFVSLFRLLPACTELDDVPRMMATGDRDIRGLVACAAVLMRAFRAVQTGRHVLTPSGPSDARRVVHVDMLKRVTAPAYAALKLLDFPYTKGSVDRQKQVRAVVALFAMLHEYNPWVPGVTEGSGGTLAAVIRTLEIDVPDFSARYHLQTWV